MPLCRLGTERYRLTNYLVISVSCRLTGCDVLLSCCQVVWPYYMQNSSKHTSRRLYNPLWEASPQLEMFTTYLWPLLIRHSSTYDVFSVLIVAPNAN